MPLPKMWGGGRDKVQDAGFNITGSFQTKETEGKIVLVL
jgi:hypothetical protein